jgi:tRNA pseudouridine55 synthase
VSAGMDGILVIDKPAGPTSFDVVRRLRQLGTGRKAGHVGTLDPMATGVLPICLGEATKIAGFLVEGEKTYEGVVQLGSATDSYDATGKVVAQVDARGIGADEVLAAVATFRGAYWQTPPMFSAVKVDGERLYEKARRGEEVERRPRKITVHEIEVLHFDPERVRVALRLTCSKGTYVRSIAHELGEALGVGGHLAELRRTRTGSFGLDRAVSHADALQALRDRAPERLAGRLIGLSAALPELPEVQVDAERAHKVSHGMALGGRDLAACHAPALQEGEQARVTLAGRLLAVGEYRDGALRYARVLSASDPRGE